MKPAVRNILLILFFTVFVYVMGIFYPKYALRFVFFGLALLLDFLYYKSLRKNVSTWRAFPRGLFKTCYLLPSILIIPFLVLSIATSMQKWPLFLQIYFPGFFITLFLGKAIFLAWIVLGDALALLKKWFSKKKAAFKRIPAFFYTGIAAGCLTMLLFLSGMIFWVFDFKVRTVEIKSSQLPPAFDQYRIVQISDFHLGSWLRQKPLQRAVDEINALNPDLIVFTGDLVNYQSAEAVRFAAILKQLKARDGIFTILGNHDYGDYVKWDSDFTRVHDTQHLVDFSRSLGWKFLLNQNDILKKGPDSIALIGVENWSESKHYRTQGNLQQAIRGVENVPFQILLSHDPSHWEYEVTKNYPSIDLTLSGHTHAMQMGIECGNFQWSPAVWRYHYWAGLYQNPNEKEQYLYVNRGIGVVGYPGRIGIRPEITLLILEPAR